MTHPALVGGYHRPASPDRAQPGLHAVSPRLDRHGARRSVCGLVGRFVLIDGMDPFADTTRDRCRHCVAANVGAVAQAEAHR